jgi:glycine dehydrogenase
LKFRIIPPHTAAQVSASEWTHAYPRELAAFPLAVLKQQKYWPPVARVDNVYGDKNVFCSCVPINEYEGEIEAFSEPMVS